MSWSAGNSFSIPLFLSCSPTLFEQNDHAAWYLLLFSLLLSWVTHTHPQTHMESKLLKPVMFPEWSYPPGETGNQCLTKQQISITLTSSCSLCKCPNEAQTLSHLHAAKLFIYLEQLTQCVLFLMNRGIMLWLPLSYTVSQAKILSPHWLPVQMTRCQPAVTWTWRTGCPTWSRGCSCRRTRSSC